MCIDEATIENGCLQIVAGHQHDGLYKEWEPLTEENMADMEFVHCPTKPGDMVIFDCYTPHSSDSNYGVTQPDVCITRLIIAPQRGIWNNTMRTNTKITPLDIDHEKDREYVFRV